MANEEATIQEKLDALKDTPEMAAMLNTHGKTVLEANSKEIIGKAQGEAYGHLDTLAKEVLGIDKERNIKTTDLFKPLLTELKTLRENKGATSEDVAAALLAQKTDYDAQILAMKGVQEGLETKNSELLSNGTKRDIAASISKELQGKAFKPHYSEKELEQLLKIRTDLILSNGKIEDGKIVFYKPDGTKRLNTKGLPITATEIVEADYGDMYLVKKAGGDGKNDPSNAASMEGEKVVLDMTQIKTRDQFFAAVTKLLQAQGLASHTPEHTKKYKEAMLEYSYNDLPVN